MCVYIIQAIQLYRIEYDQKIYTKVNENVKRTVTCFCIM